MRKLAIFGEFDPAKETHLATNDSIEHSREELGIGSDLKVDWIPTENITQIILSEIDGMWIAPGSPYKNMDNALEAIRYARENKIPCLGTCGGFQHIIIEYARNLLGIDNAEHGEYSPNASTLFISELVCSLRGREMELNLVEDSRVSRLYGAHQAQERYYCNFGINPDFVDKIKEGPINVIGSDREGEIRIVEYSDHPFFVGTLFVPQAHSTESNPHPLVTGFIDAVIKNEKENKAG